jgi:hypothetical protein
MQRIDERTLHHLLDQVEIPPAEYAGKDGDEATRFMTKEVLDQRSHGLDRRSRHDPATGKKNSYQQERNGDGARQTARCDGDWRRRDPK